MKGIALQLYTVREPAKRDLADTLGRVRQSGFQHVQWSGMPELEAEEIRACLDAAGLRAIAGHMAVEPFEADYDRALRFWQTLGVHDVAPGGMMEDCRATLEDWRRGAARLDTLGRRLREDGIRLSYHNHAFEFEVFEDDPRTKLDILFEETDPRHLFCELDTAWVQYGGRDPAEYIRKYAGRCPVIHVKDIHPDGEPGRHRFTELGRGLLDWDAIFDAAEEAGVEWYVYEQDTCDGDPLESARVSFEFLSEHLY